MSQSELVGYARKSNKGNALKISVSKDAFDKTRCSMSKNGGEFVNLVINLTKIKEMITGDREVASVCQLVN